MRQNSKKKALIPAVAMALASVIALSGVTYAWFTQGESATVDAMDLTVQAADGIEISLDASSWKSTITKEDRDASIQGQGATNYMYSANTNQFPTTDIHPISTAGALKTAQGFTDQMQLFAGAYEENPSTFEYELTATAIDNEESEGAYGSDYIAFDLFFQVNKETNITLNAQSGVTTTNGENAHLASRVAFIDMGAQTTSSLSRTDKTPESQQAVIWEPNAKDHTGAGLEQGATENTVHTYGGVNAIGTYSIDDMKAFQTTPTLTNTSDVKIKLEEGVNKVRIYVWLEGQDVDCNNDIATGAFATKLIFDKVSA